jgi:hypothetical protein
MIKVRIYCRVHGYVVQGRPFWVHSDVEGDLNGTWLLDTSDMGCVEDDCPIEVASA